MSGLIKSTTMAARIRPLGDLSGDNGTAVETKVDPEVLELRHELEAQAGRGAERDAEIARLAAEVERTAKDSFADGRTAGLAEARDGLEERLATLQAGIGRALETFAGEMAALERLAPLLAHEALDRIFGDTATRGRLIADLIGAQLRHLDTQAVVRIEVSEADFPNAETLVSLSKTVAWPGLDLRASGALSPGDCRIGLTLGEMDIGIDQQWGRIGSALLDMAEPERAA